MTDPTDDRIPLELTPTEAQLVVTALRQMEPFWPAGVDDRTRAELLTDVRTAIDHILSALPRGA